MDTAELSWDHEEVLLRRGPRSGLDMIAAIHSTVLGPALGGARLYLYPDTGEAMADVLRLSQAMTYKAAAVGLDLGGGKAVIRSEGPLSEAERRLVMEDLADLINSFAGRYISAEDVGLDPLDIEHLCKYTEYVAQAPAELGTGGDPSPLTARGLHAAIRACSGLWLGDDDLTAKKITIIGCGRVGSALAYELAEVGAHLELCDLDPRGKNLADEIGASWQPDPQLALRSEADVLAPCAMGGMISEEVINELQVPIICGAANNQLTSAALAERLALQGVLYAPDFIVNAGGLISVAAGSGQEAADRALERVEALGERIEEIIQLAEDNKTTPLAAAQAMAEERLLAF